MPTKGLLLFFFFIVAFTQLPAQGFSVEGVFHSMRRGRVSLMVYDGDSSYASYSTKLVDGRCRFEGRVERPCVAELRCDALQSPLVFFVDNSHIEIVVDESDPSRSHITGSRPNSEYRILRERWESAASSGSLLSAGDLRLDSPYAPFLLLQYGSESSLPEMFDRLGGGACGGYHYHLLRQRVARLRCLTEGERLPDFVFPDLSGRRVHLDSVRSDSTYSLIFFGTSYCEQCMRIKKNIESGVQRPYRPIICMLDGDKRGWDAPFVEQLAIDHVPFLILLDKEGKIVARDIRIWELEKMDFSESNRSE